MMEARRLKRARRRMRAYFFGSGAVLALLYIIIAAFIIRVIGLEMTNYVSTLMLAGGVLAGGTYALIMLVWLAVNITQRLWHGKPIMENED